MELRPQDVVVVMKLLAVKFNPWSYTRLGEELAMSASNVFSSVVRAKSARLLEAFEIRSSPSQKGKGALPEPNRSNLKEFLIHGVKYMFPVERGGPTRGIPTAEGASPLKEHFPDSFPLPPVWPYAEGNVRGIEFSPLYPNVPKAALRDPELYELLTLVDAIREGRARERDIAIQELTTRIDSVVDHAQDNSL
ncbi:MAG: hypothetical protein WA477_02195 [Candidatus Sulfotelmatobacter sp.]